MDTPVTLAVTMGDPAGIGPEIAVKALAGAALPRRCRVFVIGDMAVMRQAKRYTESSATLHAMSSAEDLQDGCVNVLDMHCIAPGDF